MNRKTILSRLFPPIAGDEDQRRMIRLLLWIQAGLLAALLLGALFSYLDGARSYQPLMGAAGMVLVTMLVCRAGHPRGSSFIFLLTMILLQTSLLSLGKGIHVRR